MQLHRFLLLNAWCFLVLLGVSCAHKNPAVPEQTSDWLTALVRTFEAQPVANPPLSITRYEYKGEIVYFVPPRCCDVWSDLYRADGRVLCHPNGGFTGKGDGTCTDFLAERRNGTLIWQDPRHAP